MNNLNSKLNTLPYDTLDIICGYLKLRDINQLASTQRKLYQNFFIHSLTEEHTHRIQAESNVNMLYCSSTLQLNKKINNLNFQMKLVRFTVSTKDQGWVSDCESGSWIEVQFTKNYRTNNDDDLEQKPRLSLVSNYEVPQYVNKEKILPASSIPQNKELLNIYLRSLGTGWKIGCKRMQIVYFYSHRLQLSQKQLVKQKSILKKKVRRSTR